MKSRNVDDVMTTTVIGVHESAPYRELVDLLVRHRVSAVPVVDAAHPVIGVGSAAALLRTIVYAGVDYERILRIFAEAPQAITMSSEWEGHAYLDAEEQDAFDMVARHHDMCRRFLGAGA